MPARAAAPRAARLLLRVRRRKRRERQYGLLGPDPEVERPVVYARAGWRLAAARLFVPRTMRDFFNVCEANTCEMNEPIGARGARSVPARHTLLVTSTSKVSDIW